MLPIQLTEALLTLYFVSGAVWKYGALSIQWCNSILVIIKTPLLYQALATWEAQSFFGHKSWGDATCSIKRWQVAVPFRLPLAWKKLVKAGYSTCKQTFNEPEPLSNRPCVVNNTKVAKGRAYNKIILVYLLAIQLYTLYQP